MSRQVNSNAGGLGVIGLLGVVFVVLKLLGKITWSWWYVTLPFWGVPTLAIVGAIVYVSLVLIKDSRRRKRRG